MLVHSFDVELAQKIDDSLKSCKALKEINATDGFYQSEVKFPWPMTNREMVAKTHYSTDVQNKAYIELTKSIKAGEKYHDVEAPAAGKKPVRMDANICITMVQKISDNKLRVVSINNLQMYLSAMSVATVDAEFVGDIVPDLAASVKVISKSGPKALEKY